MKPLFEELAVSHENQVECTIAVLPVADLDRSIDFYTQKLGFTLDWRARKVCSVSRDGKPIMLRQGGAGEAAAGGVRVWIGVESDALFHEYRKQGLRVLEEPTNYPWAYEMKFADPDGNILWLGTERRADLPVVDEPTI